MWELTIFLFGTKFRRRSEGAAESPFPPRPSRKRSPVAFALGFLSAEAQQNNDFFLLKKKECPGRVPNAKSP